MESWQIALYGLLVALAVSIINYFINSFLKKNEKLKEDEIQKVFNAINELNSNVKHLTERISEHATEIGILKEQHNNIKERLSIIEGKLNK